MLPLSPFLPSMAMKYSVPAVALKLTLLVGSKPVVSSFSAIRVSAATLVPVYIAITVSNVLPDVVKLNNPLVVGDHRYQTDRLAGLPACGGSFASAVAFVFRPFTDPDAPGSTCACTKRSLAGGLIPNCVIVWVCPPAMIDPIRSVAPVCGVTLNVTLPPVLETIWMWPLPTPVAAETVGHPSPLNTSKKNVPPLGATRVADGET